MQREHGQSFNPFLQLHVLFLPLVHRLCTRCCITGAEATLLARRASVATAAPLVHRWEVVYEIQNDLGWRNGGIWTFARLSGARPGKRRRALQVFIH